MSDKDFFRSRWVEKPAFVRELSPNILPQGFQAAGVACGLKASGKRDLGLIYSQAQNTTSAACFTASGTAAPPVDLCRQNCELHALRAVVINAGNANAATGVKGRKNAEQMQRQTASLLGLSENAVGVASTGVIGVQLKMDCIERGITQAANELAFDNASVFSEAICTTDLFAKQAALEVELAQGSVRLCAQAKGAGMINPMFATMICVIETDAKLSGAFAKELLVGKVDTAADIQGAVPSSFERISVDRQLSTNDAVFLLASGASGIEILPGCEDAQRFSEALHALLRQLALYIVADGEGAKRIGRVVVRGENQAACECVAREVANSPLVKTALHGGDPNWGRIIQVVGMALSGSTQLEVDVAIEGVTVCKATTASVYDEQQLSAAVSGDEVEYEIQLPGAGCEAEYFFSDLSHGYVTINAEYTT